MQSIPDRDSSCSPCVKKHFPPMLQQSVAIGSMPKIEAPKLEADSSHAALKLRGTLLLLALVAGVAIANIYYNQPLLAALGHDFPGSASWVGLVATTTQIGFAAGMIFVSPLGDRMDRRRLILFQIAGLCVALTLAATATSLHSLIGASLLIGFFATMAQQAGPFAAELAPPSQRGHAIGTVMSGLVLGILLARTFSGLLAEYLGWRAVFAASIMIMLALAGLVALRLPRSEPTSALPYGKLLRSLWDLALELRGLREAAVTGGALFAAFSLFWTVLAMLLATPPFEFGPQAAGLFGIIGAAGAMAAPLAGKFADRRGPQTAISFAIVLIAVSFLIFGFSGTSLIGLVFGVIVLDVGLQTAQVSNQARIFSLKPEARSRVNTVYMTFYFICGAIGSATGAYAWQLFGWVGVSIAGGVFTTAAYVNHRLGCAASA